MKTSPNGALIMTGCGLQRVKEQVEKRFAEARKQGATSLVPPKPTAETCRVSIVQAANPLPRPRPPLAEAAAPLVRVAESRFRNVDARDESRRKSFWVWTPKEKIDELFRQALAALADAPQEKKAVRHEMEDER